MEVCKFAETEFQVLVADPLAEAGLARLREVAQVEVVVGLSPNELIARIGDYHGLVVRSQTQVTAAVIEAGRRLRVIARAGVGVDNIDVVAATRAGITVVNAPTGNVVAAAEHTIAMLMALARHLPQAHISVRSGEWKRSAFLGIEVRKKVLGCLGLGRVASEVARRAQGLAMQVIAYDPFVSSDYAANLGVRLASLNEVLSQSDFLSVHLPLTEQTRGMLNAETLRIMKPGARIINCARGGIIDEDDLLEVLNSGHIGGAALDVFAEEPPHHLELVCHPKVIVTPHIGGSTAEAQEQVAIDAAEGVRDVLRNRPARYAVNAPMIPPRALEALTPYIDLAERMGRFVTQLGATQLEEVELTVGGPIGEYDMTYLKAATIKGLLNELVEARVNLINATYLAQQRGLKFIERRTAVTERHENLLTLRVSGGTRDYVICGSVLRGAPHIVAIDDLWVDFPAEGHLLLTRHHDRPGIIGRVGMLLGNADVNISFMHVGRREPRGEAIMVLGVDEPIPPELFDQILAMPHTYWVKAVTL